MDVDDAFAEAIAPRYRIERTLGEGGMPIVYLARDSRHGRLVALKVLRPEVATTLGAERFLREITIAARLVHPNILPLHDSGEAAGRLYYVMPYVEGATLRQRLDREKQLPLADVADITSQIAAALDYAHAQGVVHRDVKPDNVLLVHDRVLVADFGLARALTSAASTPLTRTGTVVGTPAYMSPEQCAPGEVVDARSDVYALACMTFEMIAGVTPFRGATAQAMIAHQISGEPPSVCAERERCPQAVDDVLKRGLAKSPADRYQGAGELAVALAHAVREGSSRPSGAAEEAVRRRRRRWMPAGVLALAIVVGGWFVARNAGAGPALDRNVYVVFPFRQDSGLQASDVDGEEAARLLDNAISRWDGIRLVDNMRVSDLWTRQRPLTVDDALRAAERLTAGILAWGEVTPLGESLEIHVVAYDVSGGVGASREFTTYLPRDDPDGRRVDSVFTALADSVVVGGRGPHGLSVTGTHSVKARDEFNLGSEALNRFELRAAQAHFDAAVLADDHFALAHLWAARVRAWRGNAEPREWLADAAQAVRLSDSLSTIDKTHALALLDLAERRASDACRRYRAMTVGDSTDFAAWLGLGDCNARDDAVVRDARSPTGFVFRGSYWTAVRAYRRALALVPSFHQAERGAAFGRLASRVLPTEESTLRRGVGVPPDTQRYVAFAAFPAETLAYFAVPYELAKRGTIQQPTESRAVVWAAATMRDLMRDWIDAFPASPDAQAAYSLALEASSAIDGSMSDMPQALELARRAAAHTDSADQRVVREVAVVRLLLKFDSVAAARRLADSLLAVNPSPSPPLAGYLANLAALTGRARRAAALLRVAAADTNHIPFLGADGRRLVLPGDLMPDILALRVYAALGLPHDSVQAIHGRVLKMLDYSIPRSSVPSMRRTVLTTPAILAEEDLGATELVKGPGDNLLLEMRAALARHDVMDARAAGARFERNVESYSPGTPGIDQMTAYASMLLTIGDTALATRQLDAALSALPRARSILLEATPQAAAVGRAMMLRATLAAHEGDRATARRWGIRVAELWSGADVEARSQVEALRRAAGGSF
jgi:tetratricopeptide (TPR) repeat protein